MEQSTILFIGQQPDPEDREQVRVAKADADQVGRGRGWRGTVTDLDTGEVIRLKSASCGGACICAVVRV